MTGVETALIVSAVASAATGAMASIQQGQAASAQSNFQAGMAERDAVIAEQNATAALQHGAEDERRLRAQQRFAMSRSRAAREGRGIDTSVGSPLLISQQDEVDAELNALTMQYQTGLRARGFDLQSESARASAGMFRTAARNQKRQGMTGAGAALLKGGASLYGAGAFNSRPSITTKYDNVGIF